MRYFSGLIFLAIMTYFGWPYFHLYQLNNAVANNDQKALEQLIDFESVRKIYKENFDWKTSQMTGNQENAIADMLRGGAKLFGEASAETIDVNWMMNRLEKMNGTIWEKTSFAFFESPTRFTIRIGELGHEPVHVQMTLQDWFWRVTAIYD